MDLISYLPTMNKARYPVSCTPPSSPLQLLSTCINNLVFFSKNLKFFSQNEILYSNLQNLSNFEKKSQFFRSHFWQFNLLFTSPVRSQISVELSVTLSALYLPVRKCGDVNMRLPRAMLVNPIAVHTVL